MSSPEMIDVSSSNIARVGYADEIQELHVRFLNGSLYVYKNVSRGDFDGLLNAPSVGAYLNRNIKGSYSYERIE